MVWCSSEDVLFWKHWPDVVVVPGDADLTRVDAELQCGQTGWIRRTWHPQTASDSRPGSASAGFLDLVFPRVILPDPVQQEEDQSASSHPPPPQLQQYQRRTRTRTAAGVLMSAPGLWGGIKSVFCFFLDSVRPGPAVGVFCTGRPVWGRTRSGLITGTLRGEINGGLVLRESEAQTPAPL